MARSIGFSCLIPSTINFDNEKKIRNTTCYLPIIILTVTLGEKRQGIN